MVKLVYVRRLCSLPGMPTLLLCWSGEHIPCCITSSIATLSQESIPCNKSLTDT